MHAASGRQERQKILMDAGDATSDRHVLSGDVVDVVDVVQAVLLYLSLPACRLAAKTILW